MKSTLKTRLLASSLLISAGAFATPAYAQDAEEQQPPQVGTPAPDPVEEPIAGEGTQGDVPVTTPAPVEGDVIVVTGSRIRQDSFNSPTPIQVLDAEQAAKVGVSSATELLQRSTVASGQQIDATLNTNAGNSNATEAPPTGGAGSSNIDLRGLGVERTLVLVNGRRLGSAGVRGAPSQPDIGLLPLGLIERIDVVTEGASSIYGADAVAGVVNVILKTDFEGMEAFAHIERPEHAGGDVNQVSLIVGSAGERARIMAGGEYYRRTRVGTGERDFSSSLRTYVVDEDGNEFILPVSGFFDNVLVAPGVPNAGNGLFIFYTPGESNTGVPNFSGPTPGSFPPVPEGYFDRCELGTCYANFIYNDFYNDQDERRAADLVQPLERISFVTSGSYDLDYDTEMQAYFEGYYFQRQAEIRAATEQIFPDIPALIPQLDENNLITGYVDNPLNPFDVDVSPIITLDDLPQIFDVDVQQIRFVGGITGNFPGGWFDRNNWTYDVSASFDRGTGFQSQTVLFEPHLFNVTQGVFFDAEGNLQCGPFDRVGLNGFLTIPECTPVNFFNPSFYEGGPNGEGAFENDAQRSYLLGNRTNRTVIEQTIYAAFISGDLFENPYGGIVRFAAGYEHRKDKIDSQNDITGVQGLNAAENPLTEGETIGSRNLDEVYGEVQIPLLRDRPFFEFLQVDGAVRYTHESNFGDEMTYRARGLWRPIDWVQLSGSYGTSYRAPNLREQFLAQQGGGVSGALDPCINANIQVSRTGEGGEAGEFFTNLVNNCIASGVLFTDTNGNGIPDTTTLGTTGITTIPTSTGGNAELLPETSRSYTATVSVSPPIFGPVDADFSASYYDIAIENSVRNLGADLVISRCFNDPNFPNLSSTFCDFITRDSTSDPESRLIENVQAGFVNIGEETVKGMDFNARIRADLQDLVGSFPDASLSIAGTVTHQWERQIQTFGEDDREDLIGTFGFPKWKAQVTTGIETGPWQVLTQLNYIGRQRSRTEFAFAPSATFAGRPVSRPVAEVDPEWYQDLSLTYDMDTFSITGGVQNLWDNEPPLIHNTAGPNRNNAVSSTGYDFIGRTFFINGRVQF